MIFCFRTMNIFLIALLASFAFCLFRFELEQSASFWRGVNFYLFTLRLYAKDKQGREKEAKNLPNSKD